MPLLLRNPLPFGVFPAGKPFRVRVGRGGQGLLCVDRCEGAVFVKIMIFDICLKI